MEGIEFFISESDVFYRDAHGIKKLVEADTSVIDSLLSKIEDFYPGAFAALNECYCKSARNVPYFKYICARRFCKCNFGSLDSTKLDVDADGRYNFEKVNCPLRGECKYEGVICMPKFNSRLSKAEARVMSLLFNGRGKEDIASELYVSPETIKNHIKAAYRKLGVHSRAEFVKYAEDNDMFTINTNY